MVNRQMLFLYNPNAGKGNFKSHLSDVIDTFVKGGFEVVVRPTQAQGDARQIVEDFRYPYDIVACCGGDGTLDEVVSGMILREDRIPIGYIPAGTTNDFASSLHIPKQAIKAAEQIVHGFPFPCDIGQLGEEAFVYVAAFGLFTDVSYETPQQTKNVLGAAAYVLEGAKRLSKFPKYHALVTAGDQTYEDDFIFGMITNTKSVGGFRSIIGSRVLFDDGEFEVTLVRYPKNLLALQGIVNALIMQKTDKHIYQFRASEIEFEFAEEVPWTRDGEFGGNHRRVAVKNRRQALKLMVNPEYLSAISDEKDLLKRLN